MSIAFITSYFNFTDSKRIKNNYIEFRKRFPYKLYTAELALNHQQFFIDDSLKFTATENNIVWQKERLLNLLIETLPHNTDIIVWVDCDIVFNNNSILKDIDKAINEFNEIADNKHQLPIIDIDDSDKLKKLFEDLNDPEKIEELTTTSEIDDSNN